jgi:hypothetical protein
MKDKTWKLKYMRTEPGALYISVFHAGKTKPVADIVISSDEKIIILSGEKQ